MADQAAKTTPVYEQRTGRRPYIVADGVTVYEGMLAGLEGGYLNHYADGAADVFLGVVIGGDDRAKDGVLTGETSDTPPPRAWVDESGITLKHLTVLGTPTQAKVGDYVYADSSNPADLTLLSTGQVHPVGILTDYRSATDCDVELFSKMEHAAQALA